MKPEVALLAVLATGAVFAQDEEARIEQLISRPAAASRSAKADNRHSPRADAASAWIGRQVRVDTLDHGLYLGTLKAASSDTIVLDITLPERSTNYTLPRSAVAQVRLVGGDAQ